MRSLLRPIVKRLNPKGRYWYFLYRQLDGAFRLFDDQRMLTTPHLRLIPPAKFRTGGQSSLAEYGYSAGVLAAYINEHLHVDNPTVLDLGCGTGKLVGAVQPFLGDTGKYFGLDILKDNIEFAQSWYPSDRFTFIHANINNDHYNPGGIPMEDYRLPFEDESVDVAVAFSLFTHLNQIDSDRYFCELARVLKPNGVALFTFFLLDERYLHEKYIGTRWEFDRTIDGQPEWHWASWFAVPEQQIAVTRAGIDQLIHDDFTLEKVYEGWWTGQQGAHLQDTLVFRKQP